MRLKRLNYATGYSVSASSAEAEKKNSTTSNPPVTYKDRGITISPGTLAAGVSGGNNTTAVKTSDIDIAKLTVPTSGEEHYNGLSAEDMERLRKLLERQYGAGQNENPGGGGNYVVNPGYTHGSASDGTPVAEPASSEDKPLTTTQKVLAWAKANALYLGIAAIIIYILYKKR